MSIGIFYKTDSGNKKGKKPTQRFLPFFIHKSPRDSAVSVRLSTDSRRRMNWS